MHTGRGTPDDSEWEALCGRFRMELAPTLSFVWWKGRNQSNTLFRDFWQMESRLGKIKGQRNQNVKSFPTLHLIWEKSRKAKTIRNLTKNTIKKMKHLYWLNKSAQGYPSRVYKLGRELTSYCRKKVAWTSRVAWSSRGDTWSRVDLSL